MTVVIAVAAGSVGALARYLATGAIQSATRSAMPVGTAVVNIVGALLLGVTIGGLDPTRVVTLALAGFLGGFTTFSTWMVETVGLGIVPKPTYRAIINLVVMPALGVALAALGFVIAN